MKCLSASFRYAWLSQMVIFLKWSFQHSAQLGLLDQKKRKSSIQLLLFISSNFSFNQHHPSVLEPL